MSYEHVPAELIHVLSCAPIKRVLFISVTKRNRLTAVNRRALNYLNISKWDEKHPTVHVRHKYWKKIGYFLSYYGPKNWKLNVKR